ncbi:hypothetical protein [Salibacterium halotolerans]|uniref:hypothetical protein n=1 Tax=Salibacterium halotolerans TaxID=1884432 RepID=UPI001479EE85|nr:hypothetical protein [Salibacterium halotolerans]
MVCFSIDSLHLFIDSTFSLSILRGWLHFRCRFSGFTYRFSPFTCHTSRFIHQQRKKGLYQKTLRRHPLQADACTPEYKGDIDSLLLIVSSLHSGVQGRHRFAVAHRVFFAAGSASSLFPEGRSVKFGTSCANTDLTPDASASV